MIIEQTNVIIGDSTVGHMEELRFGKRRMPKAVFKQIKGMYFGTPSEEYIMRTDVSVVGYVIDYSSGNNEMKHYLIYNKSNNQFNRIEVYPRRYWAIDELLNKKGVDAKQLVVGA